jgi:hypothetical protein
LKIGLTIKDLQDERMVDLINPIQLIYMALEKIKRIRYSERHWIPINFTKGYGHPS